MTPADLEQYLHDHIPLSKAMRVTCRSATPTSVVLEAPLEPNINHQETVFGGSASALAILAGWSLLHVRLAEAGGGCKLVIQRNAIEYLRPITGAFTAVSGLEEPERWPYFLRMLERKGTARASVAAELLHAGQVAGQFTGEFVAIRRGADHRR
jgi:thioesterase domain-containing protein